MIKFKFMKINEALISGTSVNTIKRIKEETSVCYKALKNVEKTNVPGEEGISIDIIRNAGVMALKKLSKFFIKCHEEEKNLYIEENGKMQLKC